MQLELKCLSSEGAPAVDLRWIDNSNEELFSRSVNQDNTVSAEITLPTSASRDDGRIFICKMTSSGFPHFKRTCRIGPITIKRRTNLETTAVVKPNMPIAPTLSTEHKTLISHDCNSNCSSDDRYLILYLSVATIGASMLAIVFFIVTIVMCFKYNNASNDVRNAQRNITSCDGSEPVYVSLQRCQEPAIPERGSLYSAPDRSSIYKESERRSVYKEPEKSSTYMSVEDPNNPGSKVLMPKEVFEEFYNSLTLKKI